jgi:4-hydroxy-tetrahydrodipicolinate synthase
MNAVGNVAPRPLAELCLAVWKNDLARARLVHDRLFEINKATFLDTNPIPIKYMMKRLGLLVENEHRLPMAPATPEVAQRLDEVLRRCGLINKEGKAVRRISVEREGRSFRKAVALSGSN